MTATLDTSDPTSTAPSGTPVQAGAGPRLREDLIAPDPLLDCLVEVCRQHGIPASRASLTAGLPLDKGTLPLTLAERAAAKAGLATKLQRLDLPRIDDLTLPAILILQNNQACVLLGRDKGDWRILLPDAGQGAITLSSD